MDAEQPELEDLEQPDRSGADDDRVGIDQGGRWAARRHGVLLT
jgi:hypothetical protein